MTWLESAEARLTVLQNTSEIPQHCAYFLDALVESMEQLIDGLRLTNMRVRTLIETSEQADLPDDYARAAMRRDLLDLKTRLDLGDVEAK